MLEPKMLTFLVAVLISTIAVGFVIHMEISADKREGVTFSPIGWVARLLALIVIYLGMTAALLVVLWVWMGLIS